MKLFKSIWELYKALQSDIHLPKTLFPKVVYPGIAYYQSTGDNGLMVLSDTPTDADLINPMLDNSGLNQYPLYITNLIKQSPSNNRSISSAEISFYLPYIIQEIDLVSPKLVLTLGQVTYTAITGKVDKISDSRGQIIKLGNYNILPIYHPRDLISTDNRILSPKWYTSIDLKKAKGLLDEI